MQKKEIMSYSIQIDVTQYKISRFSAYQPLIYK